MAKMILRAGKVAIKIIIPFVILGLIFYSVKVLVPAKADVESGPDELSAEFEQAETYQEQGQYAEAEQIYQSIIEGYPLTDYDFEAQTQLTILYINWDRSADADAALEELTSVFYEHPDIAQAVYNIAGFYGDVHNNYEKARQLHQYILANWPDNEKAIWSQSGLVISYIELKDEVAAQEAYDRLLSRFYNNAQIPEAVCQIASVYWGTDQNEKSRQLYEYTFNTWPNYVWADKSEEIEHKLVFADSCAETGHPQKALEICQDMFSMQPQVSLAVEIMEAYTRLRISLGQDPNVQPILDSFSTEFLNEENSPGVLFKIGKAYEAAASKNKAFAVYQAVLDNWTVNEDELWAREFLIKANIAFGNEPNIAEELSGLIAGFEDNPDLPDIILGLGSAYYRQARFRAMEGDTESEKAFYREAVSVWERLLEEFGDSEETPSALFRLGVLYAQELGEYQKGVDYFRAAVDTLPDYEFGWAAHSLIARFTEKLRDSGAIEQSEANAMIKEAYEAVVENYPDSNWTETAQLKLDRMAFEEANQ